MPTKIQWCDETWQPITGCTAACPYCYCQRFIPRLMANPATAHQYRNGFAPTCHPERLDIPSKWRKPRRIFVNSMGDLFDPGIPFAFIHKVISQVVFIERHKYLILTKQPARMRDIMRFYGPSGAMCDNLWLGISATNQSELNQRLPILHDTPAAHRFLSLEPMQGPIDPLLVTFPVDWVIVGPQTGPRAVALHPNWVRYVRDVCKAAGVPFFLKSTTLDGVEYTEFPEGLR